MALAAAFRSPRCPGNQNNGGFGSPNPGFLQVVLVTFSLYHMVFELSAAVFIISFHISDHKNGVLFTPKMVRHQQDHPNGHPCPGTRVFGSCVREKVVMKQFPTKLQKVFPSSPPPLPRQPPKLFVKLNRSVRPQCI